MRSRQGRTTRPILAAPMPVRAIQKKWAPRAVLFPWEIGGYMALAVLIAVMADGLAWALDIGVAVLAGAAAACIVQFALSRNLSMANSAGQRVRAKILTHYVLGTMEGRVAEAFRKADENPQDGEARRDARELGREARADAELLESEYAIIDGGPQGFGVDRYEFIVARENRGRGLTKLVTLDEKLEQYGRA
jgi:hypothetical protein